MNYCVPEAIPVPCGWFLATPPPLSWLLPWLTHQHQHLGVLGPPLCPFSLACSPPSPLLYSSSCSLRRAAGLGSQCGGPSPRMQRRLCPGAGRQLAPKINTVWVREQRWAHQPPGLPEDDALPSHRPRPEAQRAVLDRRTPLAQSFISRKALHNTCHLMSSKAVPLPY